jgi:hypothetical protein
MPDVNVPVGAGEEEAKLAVTPVEGNRVGPPPVTTTNPWPRVKDHPIVVVTAACAATLSATILIYQNMIIPNDVKVLENRIADLMKDVGTMPKSLTEKDGTISALQKENSTLKQRVFELSKENVFSATDPYPKTFRAVRIGDPIAKLDEAYPGRVKREEDYPWVGVKGDNDFFFSEVTYYFDANAAPPRVTHILFQVQLNTDALVNVAKHEKVEDALMSMRTERAALTRALKTQLVERYGPGRSVKKGTEWTVKSARLTLQDEGLFSIHLDDTASRRR